MTRKDYELIAQALLKGYQSSEQDITDYANTVFWVADAFRKDNPRFDFTKFQRACGIPV